MMNDNFHLYELLVKQHYGELTPEEEKEVEQLLAENPELREIQAEIQAVPRQEAQAFSQSLNTEAALAEVIERAAAHKRQRKTRVRRMALATASAAAVIAIAALFLFRDNTPQHFTAADTNAFTGATLTLADGQQISMRDSGSQRVTAGVTSLNNSNRSLTFDAEHGNADVGLNTMTVPAKLDFQIELADGTKVWLNSTTKFRFPFQFAKDGRDVYIDQGEAYFQIAQDANKPFTVHTAAGPVRVLGTEFNVNAYTNDRIVTSLVSGKVAVSNGNQRIELKPGTEVVASNGELKPNGEFDMVNTLSWREGIHYFNNATVNEVGVMLKRWFDIDLIVDNPEAGKTEIRGKLFRNQPLDNFISQINDTKLITFYWKNNQLHCK